MPESITKKPAPIIPAGLTNKASKDTNTPNEKNSVSPSLIDSSSVDLKSLSQAKPASIPELEEDNKKPLTVEALTQLKNQRAKVNLRNNSMTALTVVGASSSMLAGLSKMALGENNALTKVWDNLTDKVSSGAFAGFGAFGTSDSAKRKYLPQLVAQALEVVFPFMVKSEDLTMYRGIPIAAANAAADIEKLGGGKKEGYESYGESMQVFKRASQKYIQAIKENPIKAFFDTESGTSGITTSIVTGLSPLVHMLGLKKPASVLRQGSGIAVEFASKFNKDNLDKGRYALFASGGLMTFSSALNMAKEFLPEVTHKAVENFTWAFNLFGKQAQLQAYANGELAMTEKQNHKMADLPGKMLSAILGNGSASSNKAVQEDVIGSSKEEALVQTKTSSEGSTQYSLRPSYIRNSAVSRVSGSDSSAQKSSQPTRNASKPSGGVKSMVSSNLRLNTIEPGRSARSQVVPPSQPVSNTILNPVSPVKSNSSDLRITKVISSFGKDSSRSKSA